VLRLLVERGAALDATAPASGVTAFHYACAANQPDCVEALVRVGLDRIVALCYCSSTSSKIY
jgi:ankyrin repeat protein